MTSSEGYDDVDGVLCCCEFVDSEGTRRHMTELFCDCDELDQIVDRALKRQPIPNSLWQKLATNLDDRARLPGWGKDGAVRVGCGFYGAAMGVPMLLTLMATHLYSTVVVCSLLPFLALVTYRWLLRNDRASKFFVYWTLWSAFWMAVVYAKWVPLNLSLLCVLLLESVSLFCFTRTRALLFQNVGDQRIQLRKCAVCQIHVPGKDHHCVWLHCCVGKPNYNIFLSGVVSAWTGLIIALYSSNRAIMVALDSNTFSDRFLLSVALYGCVVLIGLTLLILTQMFKLGKWILG